MTSGQPPLPHQIRDKMMSEEKLVAGRMRKLAQYLTDMQEKSAKVMNVSDDGISIPVHRHYSFSLATKGLQQLLCSNVLATN